MYTYKLKCPKCGSLNCEWIEEIIIQKITKTKKNGWLSKRKITGNEVGDNAQQIICLECGYETHPLCNPNDFVVESKEVEDE